MRKPDGRQIVVVKIVRNIPHEVKLLQTTIFRPSPIMVDGEFVGWVKGRYYGRELKKYLPYRRIWEHQVHTSEGRVWSVYSSAFIYSTLGTWSYSSLEDGDQSMFSTRVEIYGRVYTFSDVNAGRIKVGDTVAYERPFRLDSPAGALTNGMVAIPLVRPVRKEWEDYPEIVHLKGITAPNWGLMIRSIYGKYLADIITIQQVKAEMKREGDRRKRVRDYLAATRKGQCYTSFSVEVIYLGVRTIFCDKKYPSLFIVDGANYGCGLYAFESYDDAIAWAEARIDHRDARSRAVFFTPHTGDWNSRLNARLAAA